ncbi:DUF5723 family protein [Bacteroidales bacterium OttesenSCG-928-B11]|nr:DUF5723 family protein [Bacteroidales bacterium OttesenSCG-928-C03]MDL2311964.1 DUF5723 family protein [Bacteroidales bacterium OttesenSCG-928-B11]
MKKIYIIFALCLLTFASSAQNVMTQNFMRYNPYFNSDNPAHHTPYKGYIGMPAVSNLNLSFSNTSLHYDKLLRTDSEGYPVSIDADKFIKKLSKQNNWLNLSLNEEILGFGFRAKSAFITFSTRTRMNQYFKFSEDLFAFPLKGNMAFTGDDNYANPSANITLDAYQEFALGVQVAITDKLYIGIKPKLLIGIANIRTRDLSAKIYTDPVDYAMTANYNVDISVASAIPISYKDGNFNFNFDEITGNYTNVLRNIGFSLDLGAVYRINDNMGVGASLLDMGFIKWKTDGIRITSQLDNAGSFYSDGDFFFNGLTSDQISQLIEGEEARTELFDSLGNYFPVDIGNVSGEKINLTMRFSAEYYYQINDKHRFTAYFMGSIIGKKLLPQFTLAYNGKLAKVFDICAHYTMKPNSFTNLGIGLGFDLAPIYLYFGTDNILGAINPLNANTLNLQLGLVFKWGKIAEGKYTPEPRKKKKEKETTETEKAG